MDELIQVMNIETFEAGKIVFNYGKFHFNAHISTLK